MIKLSHHVVSISTAAGELTGCMSEPQPGHALVLFAQGSGSSRLSPRNREMAKTLESAGFGTLLFDLLTDEEELNYGKRFDIPLLAQRLAQAYGLARQELRNDDLPIALFGTGTGAAAALVAAAQIGPSVKAVVSGGGRPELAHEWLRQVRAATLLVVGELDEEGRELHVQAMAQIPDSTVKSLEVVSRAGRLIEEPGAIERVAGLARDWFSTYAVGG